MHLERVGILHDARVDFDVMRTAVFPVQVSIEGEQYVGQGRQQE